MPIARIHFDVSYGVDAGAATSPFAASTASNAIINGSTPPPPPPSFPALNPISRSLTLTSCGR